MIPLKNGEAGPDEFSDPASFEPVTIKDYWEWSSDGLCRKNSPKIFDLRERILQAKFLCDMCPVKSDCLIFALIYDEYGVWGGTTKNEREKKFSKEYKEFLIEQAKLQGVYFSRNSPGSLIRAFLARAEEQ